MPHSFDDAAAVGSASLPAESANGHASPPPLDVLKARLKQDKVTKLALLFLDRRPEVHLKDQICDGLEEGRRMWMLGHNVWNFGSDSFLGLDRDRRVQQALIDALPKWGTHNGASRAFNSIALCEEAEQRVAKWLGVENTLFYPSVTLTNVGLIPGLVGPGDLVVVDRLSHDSVQQGVKLAAAGGAKVRTLQHCSGDALRDILQSETYKGAIFCIDGVYSMTGEIPPLKELYEATTSVPNCTMYVDDAHGTGVVGPRGRGAAASVFGSLDDILMIGSLSKGFSCMGGFVTCGTELKRILKIRSSTFIFGGPVPPPYLAGIVAVCEILDSPEGETLLATLRSRLSTLTTGLRDMRLRVGGGVSPIVSVTIGDIEQTLAAGRWMFDRGIYVQSATYPAVPIHGGVLRIQVNANHPAEAIDDLLTAFAELMQTMRLPTI
jgi:7-keto-8-aminopelargonate synthetase-like enzyme